MSRAGKDVIKVQLVASNDVSTMSKSCSSHILMLVKNQHKVSVMC